MNESSPRHRVVVIGATGDVGRGTVAVLLNRGWRVIAVARTADGLAQLAKAHPSPQLRTQVGSVADDVQAAELAATLAPERPTAVVNTISLRWPPRPVLETPYEDASQYWQAYLGAHLATIKAFVPLLGRDGLLLGVGGGMADFVAPGLAAVSMAQAAQRMLYRTLARELGEQGPAVRELMIYSKVRGHSNWDAGKPEWLTATEIGEFIADIIADPQAEPHAHTILKITPQDKRGQ